MVGAGPAWLSAITKTGSAPLPEDARTTIPAAAGVHLLQAGDAVPDTPLIDQDGQPIALTDLARLGGGRHVHLHALSAAAVLPADRSPLRRGADSWSPPIRRCAGKVRLLSISFDPAVRSRRGAARARREGRRRSHRVALRHRRRSDRRSAGGHVRRQRHPREGRHHHAQPADRGHRSVGPRRRDPRQQRLDRGALVDELQNAIAVAHELEAHRAAATAVHHG